MKELKPLSIEQILKWELNANQLQMQIDIEKKRNQELTQQLKDAQIQSLKIKSGAGAPKISGLKMNVQELATYLSTLRAQNVKIQTQLKEFKAKVAKEVEEKGLSDHERYARVMRNISNAADIRETWDSDDVLLIDDYVMYTGISYEEAKKAVQERREDFEAGLAELNIEE